MRFFILALFLFSNFFSVNSQNSEESVPFVAYWSVGDAFVYEVEKISVTMSDGNITKNDTTRYTATFSVTDSTATSYTVNYLIKNDFSSQFGDQKIPEALKKFEQMEVLILTDELGTFQEIKNWKEVSGQLTEMTNQIVSGFIQAGIISESEKETVLQSIQASMASKQAIEQLTFQEIQLMLFPFGAELSTEELSYEEPLPNLLGGDPLRANSTLGVSDINKEETTCTLTHTMSVNKKDSKELINDLLESMGLETTELKKAINKSKYETNDVTVSSFNYDYGLLLSLNYTRNFNFTLANESTIQIKKITIELLEVL